MSGNVYLDDEDIVWHAFSIAVKTIAILSFMEPDWSMVCSLGPILQRVQEIMTEILWNLSLL